MQTKPIFTNKETKLIKDQFYFLVDVLPLNIKDERTKKTLLSQTVLGRLQKGHGFFKGKAIPNATLIDVVQAVGLNLNEEKEYRQKLINEVPVCLEKLLNKTSKKFVNKKNQSLYRLPFLEELDFVHDKESFKGIVLASRMDSIKYRKLTKEHYKTNLEGNLFQIGGGKEYPVNLNLLKKYRLSVNDLAQKEHDEKRIQYFKDNKIIINNSKNTETAYIRHKKGIGTSDDASLIQIGKNHGISAMDLGFIIDATDTYGKLLKNPVEGGCDEFIGEYMASFWKEKYNEELVSLEECMEIIYLGSKNNFPKILTSSSHRRFIQKTDTANPTYLNYRNYVLTGEKENFKIGFEKIPSKEFYSVIEKREEISKNF